MKKLEIVSMVRIEGKWYRQEEIPVDEFRRLLEAKITESMENIGFIKVETSESAKEKTA
ncbi:hypothetical protein [Sporofaciens sp. JLR.KK001]|uniref:hypothetical protein n=1 Tax=Sporofaciens sp. JLR.KK001 TaxID=3112621 RepID=UPI002FF06317